MKSIKEFYRYDTRSNVNASGYSYGYPDLTVFYLQKETPKGYWISEFKKMIVPLEAYAKEDQITYRKANWKFILKNAKASYAYPTKEEALYSYGVRCLKRQGYLKRDLTYVNQCLVKIPELEKEINLEVDFLKWLESDNVVKAGDDRYQTQCTQYFPNFTYTELLAYYKKEYCHD